jgi:hypothetical protein
VGLAKRLGTFGNVVDAKKFSEAVRQGHGDGSNVGQLKVAVGQCSGGHTHCLTYPATIKEVTRNITALAQEKPESVKSLFPTENSPALERWD